MTLLCDGKMINIWYYYMIVIWLIYDIVIFLTENPLK